MTALMDFIHFYVKFIIANSLHKLESTDPAINDELTSLMKTCLSVLDTLQKQLLSVQAAKYDAADKAETAKRQRANEEDLVDLDGDDDVFDGADDDQPYETTGLLSLELERLTSEARTASLSTTTMSRTASIAYGGSSISSGRAPDYPLVYMANMLTLASSMMNSVYEGRRDRGAETSRHILQSEGEPIIDGAMHVIDMLKQLCHPLIIIVSAFTSPSRPALSLSLIRPMSVFIEQLQRFSRVAADIEVPLTLTRITQTAHPYTPYADSYAILTLPPLELASTKLKTVQVTFHSQCATATHYDFAQLYTLNPAFANKLNYIDTLPTDEASSTPTKSSPSHVYDKALSSEYSGSSLNDHSSSWPKQPLSFDQHIVLKFHSGASYRSIKHHTDDVQYYGVTVSTTCVFEKTSSAAVTYGPLLNGLLYLSGSLNANLCSVMVRGVAASDAELRSYHWLHSPLFVAGMQASLLQQQNQPNSVLTETDDSVNRGIS